MAFRYATNEAGERIRFRSATDEEGNVDWFPSPEEQAPMVSPADLQDAGPQEQPSMISGFEGERPMGAMDYASGVASSAGQGATAGWLDEALAAPMAGVAQIAGDAPKGESAIETYNRMKNILRERQTTFEKEAPGVALASKVVGGVLPISKALQGGGLAKTGAVGAGYGAAEYAGTLDDWSDADLVAGVSQTALSGLIPVAMQKSGSAIRSWMANRRGDEVNALLRDMAESSGRSPREMRNKAADMGPEASMADVSGAAGINYAQGGVGAGGAAASDIAERNLHKVRAAKDRLRSTMEQVSGKKEGQYYAELDDLIASRKANAEKMYGAALNEGYVAPTTRMLHIFNNNPSVKKAWADVQDDYVRNGKPIPKLFSQRGGKAVNIDGERWPNMRAIQSLKWKLDKRLKSLKSSPNAADKEEYHSLKTQYNEFMSDVNKENPLFKKANRVYAGDSAMIEAQELGYKSGLGSVNVETELRAIEKMGRSEKDAYLQGIMSKTYGKLGASSEEVMGSVQGLSSENSFKVLSKIVGKDKAKKLMSRIKTEKRYREVENKVMQGTQTQPRQQAVEDIKGKMATIPTHELVSPLSKKNIAAKMLDTVKLVNPRMDKQQVTEFVDILTKPGGVDKAILRMEMRGMGRKKAEGIVGKTMKALGAVVPSAGGSGD